MQSCCCEEDEVYLTFSSGECPVNRGRLLSHFFTLLFVGKGAAVCLLLIHCEVALRMAESLEGAYLSFFFFISGFRLHGIASSAHT